MKGSVYMGFLRWLGGIVVFFWALGLIFRIGGSMIHLLLIVAAIVFIMDVVFGRRKRT
jgi:hypothetical protein